MFQCSHSIPLTTPPHPHHLHRSLLHAFTSITLHTPYHTMPSPPLPYTLLTTPCLLLHYPTHSLPHHAFTSITLHTPYHTMPSPPLPYTLLTTPCLLLHSSTYKYTHKHTHLHTHIWCYRCSWHTKDSNP